MTAPKVGDRVRVVVEGPVVRVHDDMFYVGERADDRSGQWIYPTRDSVVSVEVLPPPEPEWKPEDVVRDAVGATYIRTDGGWWRGFSGSRFADSELPRPLTRLVPEGQS